MFRDFNEDENVYLIDRINIIRAVIEFINIVGPNNFKEKIYIPEVNPDYCYAALEETAEFMQSSFSNNYDIKLISDQDDLERLVSNKIKNEDGLYLYSVSIKSNEIDNYINLIEEDVLLKEECNSILDKSSKVLEDFISSEFCLGDEEIIVASVLEKDVGLLIVFTDISFISFLQHLSNIIIYIRSVIYA